MASSASFRYVVALAILRSFDLVASSPLPCLALSSASLLFRSVSSENIELVLMLSI